MSISVSELKRLVDELTKQIINLNTSLNDTGKQLDDRISTLEKGLKFKSKPKKG